MCMNVRYMPKFKTKTYFEAVEMAAKMMTVESDSTAELAMIAYIYNLHPHKVMKDISRCHAKWARLIMKDEK